MRAAFLALILVFLAPAAKAADPLIVISIDGFRADYLDRGVTPTLAMLAREGVRAAMQPSFPALTYPNHYTLVTGLRPDRHGVVDNEMWDETIGQRFTMSAKTAEDPRWWEGAKPLWTSAEEQKRATAVAGWPGSEKYLFGKRPRYLDPWRDGRTADETVAVILNWLDLPAPFRPVLILGYFAEIDHDGHVYGPGSREMSAALRKMDAVLATLVAGLKRRGLYNRTNLVLVADHGMTNTPPGQNTVIDRLVPPMLGLVRSSGSGAGIDPLPGRDAEVASILLKPHEHFTCWRKGAIPPRLHYGTHARIPQFYCQNHVGWRFRTEKNVADNARENPGNHGFDIAHPHMQALFVGRGPAFRRNVRLDPFDNVDVYTLLARLSGVTPEKSDGGIAAFAAALR
jgi:predicted AlkP superfamily pyrophosphatase or phosphodiesterase